jgi:hypothetical protein
VQASRLGGWCRGLVDWNLNSEEAQDANACSGDASPALAGNAGEWCTRDI